ncbi:MAG: SBBP repeat-containing protein, partial [Vicingaceae bacterium]
MKNYYYLLASCLFFSFQLYAQTFEWAASFSGSGYDHSSSITLDQNGNVYSTGYFFNTVDFDPDTSVFNLTSSSSSDIYISKLDTNGQLVWAKSFTGSGTFKRGQGITIDKNGNIYTTGRFSGKVDFNPSTAPADTFFHNVTGSSRAAFISKLDSNGNFIWAKIFTGNGTVEGNSIAVDDYGNVFTTGSFAGTVDFNPAQVTFNMSSAGASDMFVSKLDASGNFEWAKKISGTSIDDGKAIAVDQLGNVCIVADVLSQVVDVDPSLNVVNLSTNGGFDV